MPEQGPAAKEFRSQIAEVREPPSLHRLFHLVDDVLKEALALLRALRRGFLPLELEQASIEFALLLRQALGGASIRFYPNFILLMDRSPGFGSDMAYSPGFSPSLSLRLRVLNA